MAGGHHHSAGSLIDPSSLTQKRAIALKMAVIARQMRQLFDDRVEALGVTRAKWVLIAMVANHPGATQREIAAKLEITDVTACRLIDRLCADGLLMRRENPTDRRSYQLELTAASQPVVEKVAKAAETYERDLFAGFEEADLQTLDALLGRLSRNLLAERGEAAESKMRSAVALAR